MWSRAGIICVVDTLKNAVRLTFPKDAQLNDPHTLFNTRLERQTVRAIDFHEGATTNEAAFNTLILEGVRRNMSKAR